MTSKTIRFGPKGKLRLMRTGIETKVWVFMQSWNGRDMVLQGIRSGPMRKLCEAGIRACDEIDAAKGKEKHDG